MHTRVCKLKFNPGLRHRKVIFKSKWHMLYSKHQVLPFTLLLQLNTCGQNLNMARDRRLNQWNFQSDEFYHLPHQMQKGHRGKSRSIQAFLQFSYWFRNNPGLWKAIATISGSQQCLCHTSSAKIPPLSFPPYSGSLFWKIIPASPCNSQLRWRLKKKETLPLG